MYNYVEGNLSRGAMTMYQPQRALRWPNSHAFNKVAFQQYLLALIILLLYRRMPNRCTRI